MGPPLGQVRVHLSPQPHSREKTADFSACEDVLLGLVVELVRVGGGGQRLILIKLLLCAWHCVGA